MEKTCETCCKAKRNQAGKMTSCQAFNDYKFILKRFKECFAYTDDIKWLEKLNIETEKYRRWYKQYS